MEEVVVARVWMLGVIVVMLIYCGVAVYGVRRNKEK